MESQAVFQAKIHANFFLLNKVPVHRRSPARVPSRGRGRAVVVLRRGRAALPELTPGRKVAVAAVLRRGRRPGDGPRLRLGLELEQRLLRGVGDHRRLPVQLLLRQLLDDHPGGGLGAEGDAAEPLALPVDPVLVELDLEEVGDAHRLHGVLDVLVGRPPGEVADVHLVLAPGVLGL